MKFYLLVIHQHFSFQKHLGKYEGIAGGISSGAVLAAAAEIHEDKKMNKK